MRLLHYSAEPFQFDPERKYDDKHGFKPGGLWLSVEGDQDWRSWCESEQWGIGGLKHAVEITLKPTANVLLIDTEEGLDAFNARFGSDDLSVRSIAWAKVKALYDDLIIAPYQWERRCGLMWYYGWDCASGVVWNLSAIKSVGMVNYDGTAK